MDKFAIIVLSCDKYSSLWTPFFSQFRKYWPNCPYKIYLGSNNKKFRDKNIITILSKINIDWSTNVLAILEQIDKEYVFVWLDDYFLTEYLNSKLFQHCVEFLISKKANHIHMEPNVPPDGVCDDGLFSFHKRGAPYRVAVNGFWNKNHLKKILLPGETPWQFEIFGSYRSSYVDGYFRINKPLFQFIQIVERGKIFREAYDYCMSHKIKLNTKNWTINSRSKKIKSDITRCIFHGIIKIPWQIRLKIMNIFRLLLVSY